MGGNGQQVNVVGWEGCDCQDGEYESRPRLKENLSSAEPKESSLRMGEEGTLSGPRGPYPGHRCTPGWR